MAEEEEEATREPSEGAWWRYRVCYRGGVQVRCQPRVDGPACPEMLEFGQEFVSRSSICLDGIVYVRLDSGWVFERRGDLQVLELLESHEEDVFIDDSSPTGEMRSALERAGCLEEVVRASRIARPKDCGVTRKIARVAEAASNGEVDLSHVGEVVWAASTLQRSSQLRLLSILRRQASTATQADAQRATLIFARLDREAYKALVERLEGGEPGTSHDLLRAFFVIRMRPSSTIEKNETSKLQQFFSYWLKTSEDSVCAAAKRSLRDPDLQFAWAF